MNNYIFINIFDKFYHQNTFIFMEKKYDNVKRARFKNVASKRVTKVLESIDSLTKCSNKNNYEYSDEDVNKMIKVIKEKLRIMETSYYNNLSEESNQFEF